MDERAAQHEVGRRFDEKTYTEIIKGYQEHLEEKQREMEKLFKAREDVLE